MRHGFSLVELSIVLVILGLLTGGILGGQALMKAAELRSVTQDFNKYIIAVNTFQDKYFALPGDMPNAAQFWGAAGGTTGSEAACYSSATGTGTQTCNGDGDGAVESNAADQYGEMFTFWQHLANAGLIEGTYTGIANSGSALSATIGENVPFARLSNSGWSVRVFNNFVGDSVWFAHDYGNLVTLGTLWTNSFTWGKILTPTDQWNIDTKMDDGKPGQGKLFAGFYATCTDAGVGNNTAADAVAASYALNVEAVECGLLFVNAF